jgi:ribosomal protein S18 acetylase RimI-like enzyme
MVYEFNQPAIRFYEELGYDTFTRRMTKALAEPEPAT